MFVVTHQLFDFDKCLSKYKNEAKETKEKRKCLIHRNNFFFRFLSKEIVMLM